MFKSIIYVFSFVHLKSSYQINKYLFWKSIRCITNKLIHIMLLCFIFNINLRTYDNMHVVFQPSPSVTHKYRVTLPNHRSIDFGNKGVSTYSEHGNPRLMRAHLLRKGAIIPKKVRLETDPYEIHRGMLMVDE